MLLYYPAAPGFLFPFLLLGQMDLVESGQLLNESLVLWLRILKIFEFKKILLQCKKLNFNTSGRKLQEEPSPADR